MKKGFFKRLVAGAVSAFLCAAAIPTGISAKAADYQEMGTTDDGYSYELWNQYGQGTAKWTLGANGAYNCEWSNIENVLFRTGQRLGSKQSYDAYDGIYIDYDVDYYPMGNSYLCVYGWTENGVGTYPTVEYYIVEAWGSWRPPGATQSLGTVNSDGGTYDIYRTVRTQQPSIHGTETFYQYWSVRQTNPAVNNKNTNLKGTITVSNHFDGWKAAGLDVSGKLYEVALNTEGYQSSGKSNVKKNDLVFGSVPDNSDTGSTTPSKPTVEPDANGYYFHSTFESGKDDWDSRGSASIAQNSENYYAGSKSLFVSGREDNWNGTAISLPTDAFVAGNTYSFSTAVLQNSGEATEMKLTLQYSSGGEDHYDQVAAETAKSGEWTKLENTSFTIPTGASNLLLYVEAPDSLTDFYIDEVIGAVSGTKSKVTTGGGTVAGQTSSATTTAATTPSTATTTKTSATTISTASTESDRLWGDANCDGKVNIADAVAILQYLANSQKYPLTDEGLLNADVYENGGSITGLDAISIQKYDAKVISSLPESYLDGKAPAGSTVTRAQATTTPATTAAPAAVIAEADFENGNEGWISRGGVSIASDSASYYSGSKSLNITGREDTWQGIAFELSNDFSAGKSYSFDSAVMQASGETVTMKMTLQYTGTDGDTHYDTIAEADVADKTWTALGSTSYTIPEGAADLLLYVETDTSLTDFYLDSFTAAHDGAAGTVVTGKGVVGSSATNTNKTTVIDTGSNDGSVDTSWIDPSKPMVAICFDDGAVGSASTDSSMRIINAIADSGFHATFFYVGNWIRNASGEAEVKYAFSKGMEIANHSTSHPDLTTKSASEIRSEFDTTKAKLDGIIGAESAMMMRLPYLASNATVQSTLNDVALISCSVDTQDWNGASSNDIINTIKTAMNNGTLKNAIVLCHETYDSTATAMEYLAPYLKEQGWQIVTVSEMFAVNGKTLQGGQVYRNS